MPWRKKYQRHPNRSLPSSYTAGRSTTRLLTLKPNRGPVELAASSKARSAPDRRDFRFELIACNGSARTRPTRGARTVPSRPVPHGPTDLRHDVVDRGSPVGEAVPGPAAGSDRQRERAAGAVGVLDVLVGEVQPVAASGQVDPPAVIAPAGPSAAPVTRAIIRLARWSSSVRRRQSPPLAAPVFANQSSKSSVASIRSRVVASSRSSGVKGSCSGHLGLLFGCARWVRRGLAIR